MITPLQIWSCLDDILMDFRSFPCSVHPGCRDSFWKYCSCQSEIPCLSQIVWKKTLQRWSRMRGHVSFASCLDYQLQDGLVLVGRERERQHVSEWESVCSFLFRNAWKNKGLCVRWDRWNGRFCPTCSVGRRDPHMLRLINSIPFCTRERGMKRER